MRSTNAGAPSSPNGPEKDFTAPALQDIGALHKHVRKQTDADVAKWTCVLRELRRDPFEGFAIAFLGYEGVDG